MGGGGQGGGAGGGGGAKGRGGGGHLQGVLCTVKAEGAIEVLGVRANFEAVPARGSSKGGSGGFVLDDPFPRLRQSAPWPQHVCGCLWREPARVPRVREERKAAGLPGDYCDWWMG